MRRPTCSRLLLALALAVGSATASPPSPAFEPRTGDAWVDTWLADINRYGVAYRDPFVDELVRFHKAPRELVLALLARPGWTPADVYFACSLAAQAGRPCRYVADEYDRDRAEGWGALAQRLGVTPGSPAFHRLKRGFVPTYERWGRPIRVDDDAQGRADPARVPPVPGVRPGEGRGLATEATRGPEASPERKPVPKTDGRPGASDAKRPPGTERGVRDEAQAREPRAGGKGDGKAKARDTRGD